MRKVRNIRAVERPFRRVEEALRQSEERFRRVFEDSPLGMAMVNPGERRFDRVNAAFCRMLGYTAEELLRLTVTDVTHPEHRGTDAVELKRLLAGETQSYRTEKRYLRKDGGVVWGGVIASVIRDSGGKPLYSIAMIEDISARKRTEDALRMVRDELEQRVAERTARLRILAARLTHAEHRERRRIADVLHEDLQQHLVAMQYRVSALRAREGGGPNARDAEWLLEELDRTIELSRDLTIRLRPPVLYELGFIPALGWLADDMRSRFELAVTVEGVKSFRLESDEIRVFLFEAIRELLMNVVKHAGVKRARIRIGWAGTRRISIEVSDSGKGFDTGRHMREASFGLFSIRERIEALGGRLDVASRPGRGTRAVLVLPARSGRFV